MDDATLEQYLVQVERHVIEGENHIARQRQIVGKLAKDIGQLAKEGRDLKSAQDTLAQLESAQAVHIAERNRLRAKLAAMR